MYYHTLVHCAILDEHLALAYVFSRYIFREEIQMANPRFLLQLLVNLCPLHLIDDILFHLISF